MSSQKRLDQIVDVLVDYARQDFTPRLPISPCLDEIDAIATGINLLAEELDGEVASRRELLAAYERLQATQAQLVISEKFATIGQIANSVAHELNNPATWVLLGLGTIERRLARAKGMAEHAPALMDELVAIERALADTKAGVQRMQAVVGDLRTLARADADALVPLDLNEIVRATCQLARPSYHSVAELVLDLGELPPVLGDQGRLGQVVTNLLTNAAHAVADLGDRDRARPHVIAVTTRLQGTQVVLTVDDTGTGIPEPLWERIFEPYFTTKAPDVGTGIGLALVRSIATRHGGGARVIQSARGGACIEVRLAVAERSPVVTPPRATTLHEAALHRARILVIDDEPLLLRSLRQAIETEYDVVTVLGGRDALALLAKDSAFDLVMCDLQMPDVDGVTLYEQLADRAPALTSKFVVVTGGAVTSRAAAFLARADVRALQKPIELDQLLAFVRSAVRPCA